MKTMSFLLPDFGAAVVSLLLHSNLQSLLGITIKLWTPMRFILIHLISSPIHKKGFAAT